MDRATDAYRRFLAGEERAFDEIMAELFRGLVFFADRYVHDVHTAEDIAIDVFADLIVHRHRYDFRVPLKTYLYMRGRCRALDVLRHGKVLPIAPIDEIGEQADERALEEEVLADERKRAVNAALALLPEDQRTAIYLVFFAEMSYADAARVMKKSKKQVDNLLYRAKKALREMFEESDLLC